MPPRGRGHLSVTRAVTQVGLRGLLVLVLQASALSMMGSTDVGAQESERKLAPDSVFLLIKPEADYILVDRDMGGGVHEWRTRHDIRFLLFPFANPEQRISISGFKAGGFYNLLDAGLMEEAIAIPRIWKTDLSRGRTPKDIEKIFRGRKIDLQRFVGPYDRGFTLETRWNDLELALQVFWESVTDAMGYDPNREFSKYLDWIRAGRPSTPADAFRDSIRIAMTGAHPLVVKALTFPVADLDLSQIRRTAGSVLRELKGATVVVAGDFSLSAIRPLLELYFGPILAFDLPTRPTKDAGIRPPPGIVRRTVSGRTDGKTLTRLEFYGDAVPTRSEFEQVNLLNTMLRTRLVQELASNADSVAVQVEWVRNPEQSYRFTVEFLTRPAAARAAATTALAAIRTLQSDTPPQELTASFDTIRDQTVREFQVMMTSRPPDVVRRLHDFDAFQWPLREVASDSVLKAVTFEQVRAAALKFLDLNNYGHFTMTPSSSSRSSSSSTSKIR